MTTTVYPEWAGRCTEAVLGQFGIFGRRPRTGMDVLGALASHGWSFRPAEDADGGSYQGRTLAHFCADHPTGAFYVATAGHAMALVDGELFDTTARGPDRRRVIGAFSVFRPGNSPQSA